MLCIARSLRQRRDCPSVTHQKSGIVSKWRASITISSPSESPNIPVFGNMWLIAEYERSHPERGRFIWLGWVRTGDFFVIFRPISHRISETVQDRDQGYYWTLIVVPKSMTLDDLEQPLCVFYSTRLSEPTTKIWMKRDPYYQRHKSRPKIAVSSNIRFMRIFAGVRWTGDIIWEWVHRKWRFSLNRPMSPYLEYSEF